MVSTQRHRILFTAFEPSGDALAAPVIRRLLERRPDLQIQALGGPKMLAAGADLLETTTQRAAMGPAVVSQLNTHRRRLRTLDQWLDNHQLSLLVPVDSPAANWSICKRVRRAAPNAKIVHLAAPQLWAWAPWRIGKLRRLTDLVLCLLPFEPDWFNSRRVSAVFVGHPLFEQSSGTTRPGNRPSTVTQEKQINLALLPGSRPAEVSANWPTMLQAFDTLQAKHPHLKGWVAAADDEAAERIRGLSQRGGDRHCLPQQLDITTAQTDAVLDWADVVLVVSGTATLQCAAAGKPMVVLYNISKWVWWLWARWVIRTDHFSLPNLIAAADGHQSIVPELIPHFGDPQPVANALDRLIRDHAARDRQRAALETISRHFADRSFSDDCAQQLIQIIE